MHHHLTATHIERFWKKVAIAGPNECWLWTASTNTGGYGQVTINGRRILAHRIAYYLNTGDWAPASTCHNCDEPRCCNPAHLFAGDQQANVDDMRDKGRRHAKLTDAQVLEIRAAYRTGTK